MHWRLFAAAHSHELRETFVGEVALDRGERCLGKLVTCSRHRVVIPVTAYGEAAGILGMVFRGLLQCPGAPLTLGTSCSAGSCFRAAKAASWAARTVWS